jgi:ribonuclease HI
MLKSEAPKILLYTDGACNPNPGPGGWGAVLLPEGGRRPVELSGGERATTNNRMELTAAIEALAFLKEPHQIEIYTDSKYLKQGITQWMHGWRRRNWQTRQGSAVKNQELWMELAAKLKIHRVQWHWLKGHARHEWNERADRLARAAVEAKPLPLGDEDAIHIFCGVSQRQKTGLGGWCAVLRFGKYIKVVCGSESATTGNRMHILAAIGALSAIKRRLPVHLYTYSGYLKDGATVWVHQWSRRGWRTKDDTPVRHRDLWVRLARLSRSLEIKWHIADKSRPPCHMQAAKLMARDVLG